MNFSAVRPRARRRLPIGPEEVFALKYGLALLTAGVLACYQPEHRLRVYFGAFVGVLLIMQIFPYRLSMRGLLKTLGIASGFLLVISVCSHFKL